MPGAGGLSSAIPVSFYTTSLSCVLSSSSCFLGTLLHKRWRNYFNKCINPRVSPLTTHCPLRFTIHYSAIIPLGYCMTKYRSPSNVGMACLHGNVGLCAISSLDGGKLSLPTNLSWVMLLRLFLAQLNWRRSKNHSASPTWVEGQLSSDEAHSPIGSGNCISPTYRICSQPLKSSMNKICGLVLA